MTTWDGTERRHNGTDGRRVGDQHCSQHDILWQHHDEDRTNHRQTVCSKIARVEREVERLEALHAADIKSVSGSMTPWKVFALSMLILIALFGWISQEIKSGNNEIKTSVASIHRRISEKDMEVDAQTHAIKESLNKVNSSIQSLESRIKDVEKAVDAKRIGR